MRLPIPRQLGCRGRRCAYSNATGHLLYAHTPILEPRQPLQLFQFKALNLDHFSEQLTHTHE